MAHRNILLLLACVMAAPAQTPSRSENLLRLQLEGLRSRSSKLILFSGPGSTLTYPSAIDDGGTITGFYADANGGHGFLRGLDGGIVTFNAPGSEDIYPSSVNSGGAVTGNYGSAAQYGFLRTPDGAWITFTVPGTFPNSSENPIVVNDAGMIAGPYFDGSDFHGFIRTLDGSVSTLNAPGSTYTYATGLNASGAVTGIYTDANYVTHGFLRAIDGTWTSFDVPGNDFGFFPPTLSINSSGVVVGTYFDNENQGFLWQSGGSVTTFDVAGGVGNTAERHQFERNRGWFLSGCQLHVPRLYADQCRRGVYI